jgi:hypothetical protein
MRTQGDGGLTQIETSSRNGDEPEVSRFWNWSRIEVAVAVNWAVCRVNWFNGLRLANRASPPTMTETAMAAAKKVSGSR